ncbi:MAG: uroporphyrinogen decarboxylase family protein [Planctomycetota bacterium]|nr:uroporphyrinogen decarboxylase family protein [Planctomycetota bacterium]
MTTPKDCFLKTLNFEEPETIPHSDVIFDIAEVKKLTYGKIALQGNVDATLLQEGNKERIRESATYCLESASPGGGYVFSSSNTIFKGAELELYHEMLDVYRRFNERDR